MDNDIILTPAQQEAANGLLGGIPKGSVFMLRAERGLGRTTVLRKVHAAAGGALVGAQELMRSLASREPAGIEEALVETIENALSGNDIAIVDDLHLITHVTTACDYPRTYLLDIALLAALTGAAACGKKLIFGVDEKSVPPPVWRRAYSWTIRPFDVADYARVCRAYLGEVGGSLDFAAVHHFAPGLNAHQLRAACVWLGDDSALDTDRFIEYLRSRNMTSNVELEEVVPVDWNDLKGVPDVIRALEAKIALPLENDALATELRLKPKRGVLLAGPPGTGKTTIGRALAHRLKSKFFLIDGTVVAGSSSFYETVERVFDDAKRNAPSVIFIDDADVIFENHSDPGFYRYLLTMLDGLESAKAERVCVMMTAMNVSSLPPAMVRSGRIELWLEMWLPDQTARAAILQERVSCLPHPIGAADVSVLAQASRGFTGADLKAAVEDGKLLFAHDKARGQPARPAEDYFLEAIETIRANRRNYFRPRPERPLEIVKLGFSVE